MLRQVTWSCVCKRINVKRVEGDSDAIKRAIRECPCESWRDASDDAIIDAFWNHEFEIHNIT